MEESPQRRRFICAQGNLYSHLACFLPSGGLPISLTFLAPFVAPFTPSLSIWVTSFIGKFQRGNRSTYPSSSFSLFSRICLPGKRVHSGLLFISCYPSAGLWLPSITCEWDRNLSVSFFNGRKVIASVCLSPTVLYQLSQ